LAELPLHQDASDIVRDAAIQRFEYTFEAVWQAMQLFLREEEGFEIGSPKGAIRTRHCRWGCLTMTKPGSRCRWLTIAT